MPIFQELSAESADLPKFTATVEASHLMALGFFLATACRDFVSPADFELSLVQRGAQQDVLLTPKSLALVKQIQGVNTLQVDPSDTSLFLTGENVFDSMQARKTTTHAHVARDKTHLRTIIEAEIARHGPSCSLNHIDVSGITDMTDLFSKTKFTGDISNWDVSNVVSMQSMFYKSKFKGDISKWNTLRVENMDCMFYKSKFNGDIANWNVGRVTTFGSMFQDSPFRGDLSLWDIQPSANTRGLITEAYMEHCQTPNIVYWWRALSKESQMYFVQHIDAHPDWKAHLQTMLPMTEAMGLSEAESAVCVHKRWMELNHGVVQTPPVVFALPPLAV